MLIRYMAPAVQSFNESACVRQDASEICSGGDVDWRYTGRK